MITENLVKTRAADRRLNQFVKFYDGHSEYLIILPIFSHGIISISRRLAPFPATAGFLVTFHHISRSSPNVVSFAAIIGGRNEL